MIDKPQIKFFHASVTLAILACVFWTYFNFLAAEDAYVLFNRFNHLSDAPVFFYYAGYSSVFPQLVAFSLSYLPKILQAVLYSTIAFFIFYTLLREVFLFTYSGLAVVFISAFCSVIYPAAIYNLTSSFWPGLIILGLIGLRKILHEVCLDWRDVFFCLPGLLGSPLAIVFFPLYLWIFIERRDASSGIIAVGALVSYPLLTNHSGSRGEAEGLLISLVDNTSKIIMSPLTHVFSINSINDFLMSVVGAISIAVIFIFGVLLLFRTKEHDKKIALLLFLTGTFATLAISIAASSIPLQGRYWFPVVIAAVIVFFSYAHSLGLSRSVRRLQSFLVAIMVTLTLASFAYRGQSWGGLKAGWSDWSLLVSQAPSLSAIIRERHNDGGRWAIGIGSFEMTYSECADAREHPFSRDVFGFGIYCGGS